jgi:isoleucyl-tRNA synthetase
MYLEGSDQHRGWFQVSLITGAALEGKAPYRSVLTHGFVVDGQGRKMSKSLGNVMAPQQIISQSGADVLRLWVASSDYAEDVRLSPEILAQVSETYRKIRNTVRFCLSNITDLPAGGAGAARGVDRWILSELGGLVEEVTEAYEAYAFHRAVKAIHEFCTVRLSNFYLDVVKDILYTACPDDPGRRSAQHALAEIARALILMLAPVLPVTAEEAWGALPEKDSVHLQRWPASDLYKRDPSLAEDWEQAAHAPGRGDEGAGKCQGSRPDRRPAGGEAGCRGARPTALEFPAAAPGRF